MTLTSACRVDLVGAFTALPILAIAGLMSSPLHASERLQHQSRQVRLLVPLETGYELEQLLPTAPAAQLVQVEGREYVQLARFSDARVAYRLGRTVQKRTRLPFELAYDEAHPQRDGRWLTQERGVSPSVGIARQAFMGKTVSAPTAMARPVDVASAVVADGTRASQLGGALMLHAAATTPTAHEPMAGSATTPADPPLEVPQAQVVARPSQPPGPDLPSWPAAPARSRVKAEEDGQAEPRLASAQPAVGGKPLLLVGDEANEAAVPLAEPEGPVPALQTGGSGADPDPDSPGNGNNAALEELPLSEVVSTALRQLVPDPPSRPVVPRRRGVSGDQPARQTEEMPLSQVVAAALKQLAHDPPIQPVATAQSVIRPVPITAVPLVRPELLAVNTSLNYLFVKLQSPEQLAALSRHAVVVEMSERDGELLARVGVFTPTRVGRLLLNQQASQLAAMGYDLEVTHVNT